MRANFGFYDDLLISGSEDEKVYIWDARKKKLIATLGSTYSGIGEESTKNYGHLGIINEVVWNTYDTILSTSDDLSVIVWNVLK